MIVDLRLPDMPGTQMMRTLRDEGIDTKFILISAFLTTADTVEAMKSGAADVVDKPLDIDNLLTLVRRESRRSAVRRQVRNQSHLHRHPRSTAERWAMQVARACEAEGDLKTLEDWASFVGVSYTTLCESCRLLGIRPHEARDLTRMLSAIKRSIARRCKPEALLDVSDRRTLNALLDRAALRRGARFEPLSIDEFLQRQRFVELDNEGLKALRELLSKPS
jgi:CheY-like chemotaxis protein